MQKIAKDILSPLRICHLYSQVQAAMSLLVGWRRLLFRVTSKLCEFMCEKITLWIEYAHITNIEDVKYSRILTNIKTGYEYYNWLFFLIYFLEQQSPSNCTKPDSEDAQRIFTNIKTFVTFTNIYAY